MWKHFCAHCTLVTTLVMCNYQGSPTPHPPLHNCDMCLSSCVVCCAGLPNVCVPADRQRPLLQQERLWPAVCAYERRQSACGSAQAHDTEADGALDWQAGVQRLGSTQHQHQVCVCLAADTCGMVSCCGYDCTLCLEWALCLTCLHRTTVRHKPSGCLS